MAHIYTLVHCKVEPKSTNLIWKYSQLVHIDIKIFDLEVPVKSEITLSFSYILATNRLPFISCLLCGTLIKPFFVEAWLLKG